MMTFGDVASIALVGNLSFIDYITQMCINHCHGVLIIFVPSFKLKMAGILVQNLCWNISIEIGMCAKQYHFRGSLFTQPKRISSAI
jgi:hypothetical protein